ncbi:MAG TPA: isoprenylcysteine carboxylmethyltransferase family protein [Myxococcota bacterium]|jgi:protein-S-isoprenylcysteine O-methyltransferase Ste14|nr:isoprenylcysteine carboxylmethyltransferase family protein [Myxococcota bacterium]
MSEDEPDGAAVRLPPPLVYLAAVVVGGILHLLVLPLPLALPLGLRITLAVVTAGLGLALGGSAIGYFRRTGQDPKPWKSTPEIVSSGAFRLTRNPMYVGMALLQTAIALGWGNGWILLLVPVSMVVVYATAIRHEEAYLERKFGETYLAYKRSVRRWI